MDYSKSNINCPHDLTSVGDLHHSAHYDCFHKNIVVGMAYVPIQQWENIYDCCKALERGTIFSCLDKPFMEVPVK